MATTAVTLVIASYNRANALRRLLPWLVAQKFARDQWEVIVVVDGSTDDTMQVLEDFAAQNLLPLQYFSRENGGAAKARHDGIMRAKGQRIIIIDDDMEPVPEFLLEHVQAASMAPHNTVVIGMIAPTQNWQSKPLHDVTGEFDRTVLHRKYEQNPKLVAAEQFATGNVSFPRQLYFDVGGFDPNLRIDEDRELGIRFAKHGAVFTFAARASAVHHSDVGPFESWKNRQYRYGVTAIQVWRKHGSALDVHPLRHYVHGSRLNRWLVALCVPADARVEWMTIFLKHFGDLLQKLGLLRLAIATHQAIRAVQVHSAIAKELGGWQALTQEAKKLHQGR